MYLLCCGTFFFLLSLLYSPCGYSVFIESLWPCSSVHFDLVQLILSSSLLFFCICFSFASLRCQFIGYLPGCLFGEIIKDAQKSSVKLFSLAFCRSGIQNVTTERWTIFDFCMVPFVWITVIYLGLFVASLFLCSLAPCLNVVYLNGKHNVWK